MTFFIINASSDIPGLIISECMLLPCFFTGDDKNMRYVFSRTRVFSVLIKIISDIRADFQSCSVFVYPDDLIYFLLSGLCLTEGGR